MNHAPATVFDASSGMKPAAPHPLPSPPPGPRSAAPGGPSRTSARWRPASRPEAAGAWPGAWPPAPWPRCPKGCAARSASVLPAAPGPIGPRRRRYDLRFCPQEAAMPPYHIEMMEGRTVEQKKKLVEEITRVSVQVLGGSPEAVDILITDIKRENWATGGKLWSERH